MGFTFCLLFTVLTYFPFVTSERTMSTLVKVNRLPLLIDNCSAGPKLLVSQFLWRYSQYLWSYTRFNNGISLQIYFSRFVILERFGQSKSTSFINWQLFSRFETTCISIFIKVQLILVELYMFLITVLTHEFIFSVL
jgi:hypothetical protein